MSAAEGFALPDLRVVDLSSIVPHEDFDERRIAALAERVQRDGKVRNPPIVAAIGDGRFVVLDGANRVSALKYLEYRDAVVQVVDYEAVELHAWHHMLVDFQGGDLRSHLSQVPSIRLRSEDAATARARLVDHEALAILYLPDAERSCFTIHGADGALGTAECLRDLVQSYNGRADIHRVQATDIEPLIGGYHGLSALVVFPTFRPSSVLTVVRQGHKLPSGISRHVIPGRALRLNVPLSRLAQQRPREDKNAWLQQWIRQKMLAREIRYYEEPTVLFDE